MIPASPSPADPQARASRAVRRCRWLSVVGAGALVAGLFAASPAGAASTWIVSNSPTGAAPSAAFGFGDQGDVFLAGDWNGDGVDTPGIYRQRAGVAPLWVLSNRPSGNGPLISFGWGNPTGDIPIVGDWDGDGTDTVGLLRPGGGANTFFLATANAAGGGEPAPFTLGNPGDAPITGDWNGDGVDTVGLVRPTGGAPEWIQAAANQTVTGFTSFGFGNPGDLPLTGDWDGDKTETAGVFRRQGAGTGWWVAGSNTPGGGNVRGFSFGTLDDTPVVGDWDANRSDTPGVVRPAVEFVAPPPRPVPNGQNASRLATLTVGTRRRVRARDGSGTAPCRRSRAGSSTSAARESARQRSSCWPVAASRALWPRRSERSRPRPTGRCATRFPAARRATSRSPTRRSQTIRSRPPARCCARSCARR
jgi:hypothetical protein